MEVTYTSVAQFFADLKAHLLSEGMTVEREVGPQDTVFNNGSGFFRLQKKVVSPSVVAVGWSFGANADVLAAQPVDAERILPFAVTEAAAFVPVFHWYAPTKRMSFLVNSPAEAQMGRRYHVECDIVGQWTTVFHQDRLAPSNEPNFKDTNAAYLPAGA